MSCAHRIRPSPLSAFQKKLLTLTLRQLLHSSSIPVPKGGNSKLGSADGLATERRSGDLSEADRFFRIGGFARKARVSVRTVRYYDLEGLLVPRRRSLAGFRLYDQQDFHRLRKILALKELGLPLDRIRDILETEKGDLRGILARQQAAVSADIGRLKKVEAAILETQRSASAQGEMDWEAIFRIVDAKRKETAMTTFSLSPEQLRSATTSVLYPKGKPKWHSFGPFIGMVIVAALIVVPLLLRQYVGAAIGVGIAFLYLYLTIKSRKISSKTQARTQRLTSVPYRVEVTETHLQVEYDQSSLHLPYSNLHITKRGPDFYSVVHELGLQLFVPVSALDQSQRNVLDRHVSAGPIDWKAKLGSA